jgi:hypothetical protein
MQTRLFNGSWWGKGEPVYITARPSGAAPVGRGVAPASRGGAAPGLSPVNNVRFSNIMIDCEAGMIISGGEDISFDHITMHLHRGPASDAAGGNFDQRSIGTPRATAIVKHDIPAMFCQSVTGVRIQNTNVAWSGANLPDFFTDGIYCDGVANLLIDGFIGRQAQANGGAAISLKNGNNVSLRNCQAAKGTDTFLAMDKCADLRSFFNNDLSDAKQPLAPADAQFKIFSANDLGAGAAAPKAAKP